MSDPHASPRRAAGDDATTDRAAGETLAGALWKYLLETRQASKIDLPLWPFCEGLAKIAQEWMEAPEDD